MKEIDFSCKHDILLRDEDGGLLPMDEPYFKSELVAPDTYRIHTDGDAIYLVIGKDEALVIDSGYGCGNLREYCQGLCDVPVKNIANTHHHFDHTANNGYFDCAYMSEKSVPLATIPFPSFDGIEFPRDYNVKIVGDGDVIDIGGRSLEVFDTPDHAVGSLCFLDKSHKLLFTGDEFMVSGKMLNGTVEHWNACLEKLMARRSDFDLLLTGSGPMDAYMVDKQYKLTSMILEGVEGEPDKPMMPWMDEERDEQGHLIYSRLRPHPEDMPKDLPKDDGNKRKVEYQGVSMLYDITKIKEQQ